MRTRLTIFKNYIGSIARSPQVPLLFHDGYVYARDTGMLRIKTNIESKQDFVFHSSHINTLFQIKAGKVSIKRDECYLETIGKGLRKRVSFPILVKSKVKPFDPAKELPDDAVTVTEEAKELYQQVLNLFAASRVGNGRFYGIYRIPENLTSIINNKTSKTENPGMLCAAGSTSFIYYHHTDLNIPEVSLDDTGIRDVFKNCESIKTFTKQDASGKDHMFLYFNSENDQYEGIMKVNKPTAIPMDWMRAIKWMNERKPVIRAKMLVSDFGETLVEMSNALSMDNQLSTGTRLNIAIRKDSILFQTKTIQGTLAYTVDSNLKTSGEGTIMIRNFISRNMRFISTMMSTSNKKKTEPEYLVMSIYSEDNKNILKIEGENGLTYITIINELIYM